MTNNEYIIFNNDLNLNFKSRRSVVYGTHCIVSSSQPLACQAGLEILRKGGNAAVATAADLNVTEPCSCGIGGDCFVLYYNNQTKKISSLNGSGRSPKNLTLDKLRQMGIKEKQIPFNNLNAVTVPGAVDAFIETIKLFGSGNVTLNEIFNPAIRLAEEGYPVSEITAHSWALITAVYGRSRRWYGRLRCSIWPFPVYDTAVHCRTRVRNGWGVLPYTTRRYTAVIRRIPKR
ncbi:unnamed protein product [Rotaria socialis]|uniref:Gamma-glutamyltranspeptidase n=1 Tax=Rotaria socialis TaxID=392032 RepID=A0A818Z8D2_9BILA|nr:unnamed protein product [Rotaria socialis]